MERYTKPLSAHVLLVHNHTEFLVNRLIKHFKRSQKFTLAYGDDDHTEELELQAWELYESMKAIQRELMCVESYVNETWPNVVPLLEALKEDNGTNTTTTAG
jgi:hypothetical protein